MVISSRCKLDYKMGYLVVRGEETRRVFMDEIALLMIESTAVSMTGYLLSELVNKKIRVVFCDGKRNPTAELCPYYGSHDTSRKVKQQMQWTDLTKGHVWTAIVTEKIKNQAGVLRAAGRENEADKLTRYIGEIEFGDVTNREGHAAKVYFNGLFGMDFVRRASPDPINAALDYGYGIILSVFNREVTANGYLTQFGLFHDNVFNQFNLSCDLMEPYRPLIDKRVLSMELWDFSPEEKHRVIAVLNDTVSINGSEQTVLNSIKIYTKSVFDALNGDDIEAIKFPLL